MRRIVLALALSVAAAAAQADDATEQAVTPYRPTLSNPADLPVPGWIEGEFGGQHVAGDDGSRQDSVPWLIKYAFDENHGVLVGGTAWLHDAPAGAAAHGGVGDLQVVWKQRFPLADTLAFGVEAGALIPTAQHHLGVGTPAYVVNGIVSTDFGPLHVDVNAGGTRYTSHPRHTSAWRNAWAAAGSWSLAAQWGAALELAGTRQRGVPTSSEILAAINYNRSARLVFDAGVAYGLTHAAHDCSVFAGATVYLGRLN